MPFNIPNDQLNQSTYTGCPPGYILIDGACVHPLTEEIFEISEATEYEFVYYENAGELVGQYKMSTIGDPIAPPTYFAQNVRLNKYEDIVADSLSSVANPEDGIISMSIRLDQHGPAINQLFNDSGENFRNTFMFGEFHYLTNNPSSITRFNINADLILDGVNQNLPKQIEGSGSFIKWYLSYTRIPTNDRPFEMIDRGEPPTPRISNMVTGTDRLQWDTLRGTCYRHVRIYDGLGLNEVYVDNIPVSGHYLMKVWCEVDEDILTSYINSNYQYAGEEIEFSLLFYPPSFYAYPADTVTKTITPLINAYNDYVDEIIFKAPMNYKTDGNMLYDIEFLTAKNSEDILFKTSSHEGSNHFELSTWFESEDGEEWILMTNLLPSFNNSFDEISGADSEKTKYIKYELSSTAKRLISNRDDVLFRIKHLDGTLI